jgi:beta-glucosidase
MSTEGYIVTMAPPQSYLNIHSSAFSRYVNLTSSSNRSWHPEFHYFGHNIYAYILAKFEQYIDLVSIQLYESYSDAGLAIYHEGVSAADYLVGYVRGLAEQQNFKLYVDFHQDSSIDLASQYVLLPLDKLVIGLANGWSLNSETEKTLYVSANQVQDAYERLKDADGGDLTPRGFMIWTIDERGTNGVYLARGIHQFLHQRRKHIVDVSQTK